jgi:ABC-type branched-subunit amino acid transport system ATPase component
MTHSIVAQGLVRMFGETKALGGVDLEVPTGSVCGLLEPNGDAPDAESDRNGEFGYR